MDLVRPTRSERHQNKCRVCGYLGRPPPSWRPDQRGSPLDHKAVKRKMAEKLLAGGVAARGTSGRMPAPPRAPAARREQKTALCDAPDRYSGPGISGGTLWEGPETRCITTAFVYGGEPRLPGRTYVQHGVTEARHGLKARRLLGGRATAANPACRDEPQGLNWVRFSNAAPPRP